MRRGKLTNVERLARERKINTSSVRTYDDMFGREKRRRERKKGRKRIKYL